MKPAYRVPVLAALSALALLGSHSPGVLAQEVPIPDQGPVGFYRVKVHVEEVVGDEDRSGEPTITATLQEFDPSGTLLSELPIPAPSTEVPLAGSAAPSGGYMCLPDSGASQVPTFYIQNVRKISYGNIRTDIRYDFKLHRFRYDQARTVEGVWRRQYERCAAGGAMTNKNYRLDIAGAGVTISRSENRRIGETWPTERTEGVASSSLGFSVGTGGAGVTIGSTSSTSDGGKWIGAVRAGPHPMPIDDWPDNLVAAWWKGDCSKPWYKFFGGCDLSSSGSSDWQATNVQVLYEFPESNVPYFEDEWDLYLQYHCENFRQSQLDDEACVHGFV